MKYLEKNNIYNIDAISLIKKIKKEGIKVDLIITDPPIIFLEKTILIRSVETE